MTRAKSNRPKDCPFVGKGGLKLQHALDIFELKVDGRIAADLGCSVGGFTDCLLRNGIEKVYAVDTAYGVLDYRLRTDGRVIVCERTNVLHWTPPEPIDIVTIDLGWTAQKYSLPVAAKMLSEAGIILSLIKPQYECDKSLLKGGVLPERYVDEVVESVCSSIDPDLKLIGASRLPFKGSGGNIEVWTLLRRN